LESYKIMSPGDKEKKKGERNAYRATWISNEGETDDG